MPKTNGYITKENILKISEKLFSEKGYDGTSVDEIANLCKINKATVYYHFKSKEQILNSVMHSILDEAKKIVNISIDEMHNNSDVKSIRSYIEALINFMTNKKKLVSIIIMESLKSKNKLDLLFKCADLIIDHENDGVYQKLNKHDEFPFNNKNEYLVYEFFTGFIPIIMYIVLEDKWSEYYNCKKEKMIEYFIEAFERSHMSVHKEK
ncbi:MAG: TetR/AcrR family transcriptional regulator [Spirochaetes bacterium]|nr:TetR/AcrR family transcriptional regulator [Spirochaetota bacterium]